jgi:hypothetical protein
MTVLFFYLKTGGDGMDSDPGGSSYKQILWAYLPCRFLY